MANILKIDTSLRTGISGTHPHGSLSRRLNELIIDQLNEIDCDIANQYIKIEFWILIICI